MKFMFSLAWSSAPSASRSPGTGGTERGRTERAEGERTVVICDGRNAHGDDSDVGARTSARLKRRFLRHSFPHQALSSPDPTGRRLED